MTIRTIQEIGGRLEQQDRFAITYGHGFTALVVCDGMGGHMDGARAADVGLDAFVKALLACPVAEDPRGAIVLALKEASLAVCLLGHGPSLVPGTTLAAVIVTEASSWIVSVGDSPILAWDGRRWEVSAKPHTAGQWLTLSLGGGSPVHRVLQEAVIGEVPTPEAWLVASDGLVPTVEASLGWGGSFSVPLIPDVGPSDTFLSDRYEASREAGSRDNATGILMVR